MIESHTSIVPRLFRNNERVSGRGADKDVGAVGYGVSAKGRVYDTAKQANEEAKKAARKRRIANAMKPRKKDVPHMVDDFLSVEI